MKQKIKQVLEYSVNAPSGDNSQPWRFEISGNTLAALSIPDADPTLYNFRAYGNLVGLGAVLENLLTSCEAMGLSAEDVNYFPNGYYHDPIFTVRFTESTVVEHRFFNMIQKRATNRMKYETEKLSQDFIEEINHIRLEIPEINIHLLDDRDKINRLSLTLSLNDKLILENRRIHDDLFAFIRWSEADHKAQRDGLYIKTLGLDSAQEKVFKLMRNWTISRVAVRLGFSKLIAKDSVKLYQASGAFLLLTGNAMDNKKFLLAGRVLQKVWLAATFAGSIGLQPTAALIYLGHRASENEAQDLTDNQIAQIKEADSQIRTIFDIEKQPMYMLFRVGYCSKQPVYSLKKRPDIKFL